MQEISMELLKQADDAALERIAAEYPKQPEDAGFERAYRGFLEQSGEIATPVPVKRHLVQIISIAACGLLIVGAACLWRFPQHQIPSVTDVTEAETSPETTASTEASAPTEAESQAETLPAVQPRTEPAETAVPETQAATVQSEPPTEPAETAESAASSANPPQQSAPEPSPAEPETSAESIPSTEYIPSEESLQESTETTESDDDAIDAIDLDAFAERFPDFDFVNEESYLEIISRNMQESDEVTEYTLHSEKYRVTGFSPSTMESSTIQYYYQIETDASDKPFYVQQSSSPSLFVNLNQEALSFVSINGHPGYMTERYGFFILVWHDGQYEFAAESSPENKEILLEIARSLTP